MIEALGQIFGAPRALWLLAALPALAGAMALLARRHTRAVTRLGGLQAERLVPGRWPASAWIRRGLVLGASFFLVLALARPQWGERTERIVRRGIDVVIALDTSRSMACEDVRPNRFEQARMAVSDLLRRLPGDRVALVPFTEQAAVACPLTLDDSAVRLYLDAAEVTREIAPGTDLARAIRRGTAVFQRAEKKHKALVLVTDGEDHGDETDDAAREAREAGVVVYALAVGTRAGGPIPQRDASGNLTGYHQDEARKVVTTRRDEALLAKICEPSGGQVLVLGPAGEEVGRLADAIGGLEKKDQEGTLAARREERYGWPLAAALALLAAEPLVPRRRASTERPWAGGRRA